MAAPFSAHALDPTRSVFHYNVRTWRRQDGLPSDKVTAVLQDTAGYLWFGTQNGLVRFDGLEFKHVPLDLPAAGGREIKSLTAARDGGLWVAVTDGQFCHFDGQHFTLAIRSALLPQPAVILEARDGSVWFGGANLLARRTATGQQTFDEITQVLSLAEDASGRVWIGTDERGLFVWSNGKIERALPEANLEKEAINTMAFDPHGNLWLGSQKFVYCLGPQGQLLEKRTGGSRALTVDRHGVVWVTGLAGLTRYGVDEPARLGVEDGLGHEQLTSVFEDREGSLWVGTLNGLSQISDVKLPIYTPKDGLQVAATLSVTVSRKGGIWVTQHYGIAYFDGVRFHTFYNPELFPNPYVKVGMEARNGDFYCVDARKNINVFSDGRILTRYPNHDWPEALAEDDEGVLAGVGRVLYRIKDGKVQPYAFRTNPAPDFGKFENIWIGHDGAIWIASYSGLFRVKDGEFERWSTDNGLSSNTVFHGFEDADGAIWIGLTSGLARLKNGVLRNIRSANGLYDECIYTIVPDDHGYFWMNSSRGIFRVARDSLNAVADGKLDRVTCEPFDKQNAVKFTDRFDQQASGCKSADGRIWFPSPWGVIMIDPAHLGRNTLPPPVHIEEIRINGETLTDRTKRFKVGDDRVEFFFAALSYITPRSIQVKYRLEGLDDAWTDAGARRSALYSLKPGKYRFQVRAANADGVWNEAGDTFAFEVPPAFYQTTWFYLLCALAAMLAAFEAYRWKVRVWKHRQRKLQEANELLEAKVGERTAELAYERDLLRTLLDNSPDQIYFKDTDSRIVKAGFAYARHVGLESAAQLCGKTDFDLFAEAHARPAFGDEQQIIRTGQPIEGKVEREVLSDGRAFWVLTTKMPWRDKDGRIIGTFGISKDITKLKESEAKLIELHKQMVETSRQAGMAEVATGVLHNVGNVLNSVNVSATLVVERVRASKISSVPKISGLLEEHAADLTAFLTSDPKGQKIPLYLATLGEQLQAEREQVLKELGDLQKNVEHIKQIVALQQSFAKVSGIVENVALGELVDDALRMTSAALERHQVELVRDDGAPDVHLTVDRHKVVQILVNLIRNAKFACDETGRSDKRVILRTARTETGVEIAVVDNGVGIDPEHLTRMFALGFTTRKNGHGFGLHSSALAAKELGGQLTAHSDGLGRGAMFTLELPLNGAAPFGPSTGADRTVQPPEITAVGEPSPQR